MANKVIKVRNKVKYDTEANWAKADPVLLAGELAVSSDRNNRIKVGNGTSKWSALAFSGLKVGNNITLSNDTISLTKSNVTSALGYTPPTTNTTYNDATQSVHGLMSTADKTKLDGIATGANKTVVDSAMSTSSTNPVQNKVVKTEIDKKMNIDATPLTSEDLNNIKTYGFYYGGGSNTVKNKPSSVDAFALHVYRSASGYVVQELTDANVNERSKYIRQFTSSSWSAWLPEATFSANPTNGQIIIADGTTGKVKTSGYTIASSVPSGAKFTDTVYTHPSYTAKASGLYKVTVDDKGHVSATTAVTKSDITALGIPGQDTNTTYTVGTESYSGTTKLYGSTGTSTDGTMTRNAITTALNGKANSSHTHNYAGSSSAGGNANAAVKLATARTISLSGDASGSVSFDGSGNVTLPVVSRKYCMVGSDAANSAGWYKFADITMSGYGDSNVMFSMYSTYAVYYSGILMVQLRSDNTKVSVGALNWLTRIGFAVGAVRAVISGMKITLYVNDTNAQYGRIMAEVISQSGINDKDSKLVLYNTTTKESTEPSSSISSKDSATVSYANSAGSVAWGNVSGKPNASQSAAGLMTAADKKKLDGIASGANAYTHPSATAYASGLYKITTNNLGHVTAATAVTKADITGLGIPSADTHYTTGLKVGASATATANAAATNGNVYINALDNTTVRDSHKVVGSGATTVTSDANGVITVNSTNTTYSDATQSAHGLMTAADKKKLDGIASGANAYTHPSHTAYASGLYKITTNNLGHVTAATAVTKADITGLGIPSADTNTWRGVQDNLTSTATDQSLSANQGKVLKGLVDAKLPLAGGKLTGRLEKSAGQFVYRTVGESGKAGYVLISSFKITSTYVNVPIELTFCRRNDLTPTKISINWGNTNTNDPNIAGLKVSGSTNSVWIVKSATSSWDLYIAKSDALDEITILEYYRPPYMDKVSLTWVGTLVTALPTTNITQASYGYNVGYASSAGNANAVAWGNVSGKSNASQSAAGLMSADDKKKLDGIASGANAYSHPSATAYASGLYKITTNNLGHVTSATAVTKADITALGIPASNTDTHYTTGLKVGASATATANAAATNGNVYLNVLDNTTVRDSHKVVGSGATSVTSDANGVITISSSNTTYSAASQSASGLMTADDKKKLDGISSGANAYTHPSATAYASGLYKITTNALGHVTAATAVTKADITGLGIPASDTNTHYNSNLITGASATATANAAATNGNLYLNLVENGAIRNAHNVVGTGGTTVVSDANGKVTINSPSYSAASQSANGLMSAADKKKLDGIASGANAYSHPSATAYASGLYKITTNNLGHVTAATAVTKADITALGIPGQDSNTTYTVGTESYSGTTKLYGSTGTSTDGTMTRNAITTALNGKANSSHTHNYAGSSSAGGSANTAVKLATARTVATNNGDFNLSFSYDGSANSTANLSYYSCSANNGNKNNYPFHRFAKLDTITGSYNDKASTFLITQDYQGGGWGIVTIRLRTNSSTQASDVEVKWLARYNLAVDFVQVAIDTTAGATYADAFLKLAGSYGSLVVRNLASGSRGSVGRTWTLINSKEVDNTTTTDALTSTESYVNIATAGTKLHNKAYTKTVTSSDGATVSYANSSGTASNVKDSGNSTVTTLAYSKSGLDTASWFAAWNNYELRAISPANALKAMGGASTAVASQTANGLLSAADKKKLDGIASGANAYTHPSATAYASGLYKITTNNLGHVTAATAVTKADITALGIPGQDTNTVYTHPTYTAKSSGLYKITVDGTGHVSAATAVAKSDITALGIPSQDTNTHYSTKLVVGDATSSSSIAAATNGNVCLKLFDDSTFRNGYVIKGTGATTVSSASDGTITINSTNTVYSHPSATAYANGFYKITTNNLGHVTAATKVAKSDITALGIPSQDTTYSDVTTSSHGLMTAVDKTKLNGISSGAQNTVYSASQPTGQAIGDYWVKLEG